MAFRNFATFVNSQSCKPAIVDAYVDMSTFAHLSPSTWERRADVHIARGLLQLSVLTVMGNAKASECGTDNYVCSPRFFIHKPLPVEGNDGRPFVIYIPMATKKVPGLANAGPNH